MSEQEVEIVCLKARLKALEERVHELEDTIGGCCFDGLEEIEDDEDFYDEEEDEQWDE